MGSHYFRWVWASVISQGWALGQVQRTTQGALTAAVDVDCEGEGVGEVEDGVGVLVAAEDCVTWEERDDD